VRQFSGSSEWLKDLNGEGVGRLLAVASDVALIVADSRQGIIKDVSIGSDEIPIDLAESWLGKPWISTVTIDSRPKVEALISGVDAKGAPRWRLVNHISSAGPGVPVLYACSRLGEGRMVAFGRSMQPMSTLQQQLVSTQQSMEREFVKYRQMEARHRLLFQVASEAVLIVDAQTRKIVDANPAAGRLLGEASQRLLGRLFPEGFDAASTQALHALLGAVRATGRTDDVTVSSIGGSQEFVASASLFREDRVTYFLVRLEPVSTHRESTSSLNSKVLEIMASAPEGFVVTDLDGRILLANRAFLDLVQLATEEQSRNESLERWLGRPGVDFKLLTAQLREHGSLRSFATQLRGEYGANSEVEICAVSVLDGESPCFGFTIRDVGQRASTGRQVTGDNPRSVAQLTQMVGRVPLRDLVRDSTDMIERLCIEAALEITGDNRASAAEILGLSRQSLYAKLRRHGLGELASADGDETD
jgi:transcriptional regulator PpsR